MRLFRRFLKAVVNEIGPPLRCLLLCIARRKLRNARHATARLGKQHRSNTTAQRYSHYDREGEPAVLLEAGQIEPGRRRRRPRRRRPRVSDGDTMSMATRT